MSDPATIADQIIDSWVREENENPPPFDPDKKCRCPCALNGDGLNADPNCLRCKGTGDITAAQFIAWTHEPIEEEALP